MSAPRPRFLPPRGQTSLIWLLWLALMLPLAQSARISHGVAHAAQDITADAGKQLPHELHCELCLAGAALGSGAPPAAPAVLPLADAAHVLAGPASSTPPALRSQPAYRSRAPPPLAFA